MSRQIERSVCPYDCPDGCGLLVEIEKGRAISIQGDPEHPFTRGTLCGKMNHYEKTVHSAHRLTEPLLRCGEKGEGKFRPISWSEAISRISKNWREIIEAYGPEAILPYSYAGTMGIIQRHAGHPFFYRMGASLLDRGICTPAKGLGWQAVMGSSAAPHPDRVLQSDLIILWGCNAAATNLHLLHKVKQAKNNGARVWLIDLFRNQTAAIADRSFFVRPGSDAALALGLMHILERDKCCDQLFLETQVQGFAELKAEVLPHYSPAIVSRITGLESAVIEEMAQAFAAARAPFISLGGGLARYTNGSMTVRSIVALPALVGAWAKKGGGCFVGTSTGAAFDMARLERRDFLHGNPRTINMSRLGEALTQLEDPPVKSLYIYSSNPAAVAPDQNRVLQGLSRDDLFTVVHERFMTDSARYADILLPATSSLENSDIFRSYGHYGVQRTRPLIPAIGQSRSNLDVFSLLAAAMGYQEAFFQQSADDLIEAITATPNGWWDGINRKDLDSGRPVELTPPQDQGYATPSGKIEIYNPALAQKLPNYLPPTKSNYPLQLVTAPALKTLNSTFSEREELRGTVMALKVHPDEALRRGIEEGQRVCAFNDLGEVDFYLQLDAGIPAGLAVAEGVWWHQFAPGRRTVNALTSQRLTDRGGGSTFYDNQIEIRAAVQS